MPEKHYYEQEKYTEKYLLPYFLNIIPNFKQKKVLEVGCAEGGLLTSLQELGMNVGGVEISPERAAIAKEKNDSLKIIVGDITDPSMPEILNEKFDLIIMREVIEHIHDKEAAFNNLDLLLNNNGYLFISFPPKRSPFAGHQQIGKSILKAIPYLHTLPQGLLKYTAGAFGESPGYIDEIKLHYSTGCTIKKFEALCSVRNFIPVKKELFLFRPIYSQRFGLPTLRVPGIPLIREYITLGCETVLQKVSPEQN